MRASEPVLLDTVAETIRSNHYERFVLAQPQSNRTPEIYFVCRAIHYMESDSWWLVRTFILRPINSTILVYISLIYFKGIWYWLSLGLAVVEGLPFVFYAGIIVYDALLD